ncbi:lipopolysaccharide biosynthesis protein [Microbacterium sp. 18062]|uniref:lipopolysaccharide biosynthesis protein n=1 Tax=Microbacterium sp. 18062 TaxID=2681410 RepID=UPI00135C632F|nr:lipopolysaccharide biosynthesis protein [Microbacterium sp. 18062]
MASTAASGAAKTIGAQGARVLMLMAGVVILSRILSPSDFGLFAMVAAVANIATVIGDFGLSQAAIQARSISKAQRSNLFWSNAVLGVLLSAAIFGLSWPLAAFYGEDEVLHLTQVLAFAFLINALSSQFRAEVLRSFRFGWLAIADIAAPAFGLGLAVLAALSGWGYWALVVQQITVAVVTLVMLIIGARWVPGLPSRAPMRDLFRFGAGTLGIQLITYISTNIDDFLIGRYFGPAQTGFYSRAFQLFRLPAQQIAIPIGRVALPILSRLQDDRERLEAYALRAQLVLAWAFGGLFFVIAAAADPIIEIALGPGWDESKPLLRILAIGGVFQALTNAYSWVFQAVGMVGFQLRFSLVGRTIMIALVFVGVHFGLTGVAIASASGQALMWAMYTVLAIHRAGLSRRRLLNVAVAPVVTLTIATIAGMVVSAAAAGLPVLAQLGLILASFAAVVGLAALVVPRVRADMRALVDTARRIRTSR